MKKLQLPSRPDHVYSANWVSWSDFLGTGRKKTTPKPLLIHVADAEAIASKNNGMLPCPQYMIENHLAIYQWMKKAPSAFAHLKQEKIVKSIDEYVLQAEKLSKEHGTLPNYAWLIKNGYRQLIVAKGRFPEKFSHLLQKQTTMTIKDHVKTAEWIQEERGSVPYPQWLRKNGYSKLAACLYKHSKAFAHLNCETGKENRVEEAQKVIAKIGYIPSFSYLKTFGLKWVYECIRGKPEIFNKYKRKNAVKSLEDWLDIAKKLVVEHGGIPSYSWLRKNRMTGLLGMINRFPEQFRKMKRLHDKNGNSLKDWLQVAKQLNTKHGGIPHYTWLSKNKMSGLIRVMRQNPQEFVSFRRVTI